MGFDEVDLVDNGDNDDNNGYKSATSSSYVSCSICLEPVADNGSRSWAKLQCSHQFHLDCIGSAFNTKGAMQCPNCRKIEKGQWLLGNGSRSSHDISFDDSPLDDDFFDMPYPDMGFGLRRCPFTGFLHFYSLEDDEYSTTAYHDLTGQRSFFGEHSPMSLSTTHPCPYLAQNSSGGLTDTSISSSYWGNLIGQSEWSSSYAFLESDPRYHSWDRRTLPLLGVGSGLGGPEQSSVPPANQRSTRVSSGFSRSDCPFVNHGPPSSIPTIHHHNHQSSNARASNPLTSSPIQPPFLGSATLQAYFMHRSAP